MNWLKKMINKGAQQVHRTIIRRTFKGELNKLPLDKKTRLAMEVLKECANDKIREIDQAWGGKLDYTYEGKRL